MDKKAIHKTNKRKTPKSLMEWSWIFMLLFFALSFLDIRFAYLGFLCMAAPIGFAVSGKGKIHCSHYCPRGSLFGKFLHFVSLKNSLPAFMNTKWFKYSLLVAMFSAFGYCFYQMGAGLENVASAVLNMMLRSTLIGVIIGIVFMPRSWCKICPMGLVAGLIRDRVKLRIQM